MEAIMKIVLSLLLASLMSVSASWAALSAELRILTARAIATVLEVVGPQFEKNTGHKLIVVTGFSPDLIKRIEAGEPFDILGGPPPTLDRMIKAGALRADTRLLLTRSDVGVEVKAGAPKPDIRTVESFKQALLNAKSIGYLPVPGVPQMLDKIGVADAIKAKTTIPNTDIVSELIAKGEIELGLMVITQIVTTPGVELVGPLPPELKVTTTFGAAVATQSKDPDAARDLLNFLRSPEAVKVIREQGMEPVL
jgi:molybdate transport system substrate-binding protein